MTTSTKAPEESQRLALEYLSAGLAQVEFTIGRREAAGLPRSLALEDIAGDIATAVNELRKLVED